MYTLNIAITIAIAAFSNTVTASTGPCYPTMCGWSIISNDAGISLPSSLFISPYPTLSFSYILPLQPLPLLPFHLPNPS